MEENNNNDIKKPEMSMTEQLSSVRLKKLVEINVKPKSTTLMDLLDKFEISKFEEAWGKNNDDEENEEDVDWFILDNYLYLIK